MAYHAGVDDVPDVFQRGYSKLRQRCEDVLFIFQVNAINRTHAKHGSPTIINVWDIVKRRLGARGGLMIVDDGRLASTGFRRVAADQATSMSYELG